MAHHATGLHPLHIHHAAHKLIPLFGGILGGQCALALSGIYFSNAARNTAEIAFPLIPFHYIQGLVSIYKDNDPWAEMSFANWVQVNYNGKKFDIGDNGNYADLYKKIKEAVEKHTH